MNSETDSEFDEAPRDAGEAASDAVTDPVADPEVSEPAPVSVGERLRFAREAMRLDLAHVAAETRIPIRHLESIEDGAFNALPSRTYAIGFARNFARTVGLDEDQIVEEVRAELADGDMRRTTIVGAMEPGDPAKLPSAGLAWFGGIAALILAIGSVAFLSTYFGAGTGPAPLVVENDAETPPDGAQVPAQAAAAVAPATPAPTGGAVVFTALQDGVWVRFYEDGGERLFEAQMASGDRFEIPGDAVEPRINTGRPDLLSITIGGREVPKLAEEPVTMGDTPVSAEALLARSETPSEQQAAPASSPTNSN